MPAIITTIHAPIALAATCRRLNLPAPAEGCVHLEAQEAFGWIVRLPGTPRVTHDQPGGGLARGLLKLEAMFRKILVATDLTEDSEPALRALPQK